MPLLVSFVFFVFSYSYCFRKVDWLSEQLRAKDFTVSSLHGDLEQAQRQAILDEFKEGASRILIATDLIGRGIDVHGVCDSNKRIKMKS